MTDKFDYDDFKKQLREKIRRPMGQAAARPFLATLRGMGAKGKTVPIKPPEI